MEKYLLNGQAAGFVNYLNSSEAKTKTSDQCVWLAGQTAVYHKYTVNYRLLKFFDGTILRIQDNIMGVVSPEDWNSLAYSQCIRS